MSPLRDPRGRYVEPVWGWYNEPPKSPLWLRAWFVFVLLVVLTFWGLIGWGIYEGIQWLRRN